MSQLALVSALLAVAVAGGLFIGWFWTRRYYREVQQAHAARLEHMSDELEALPRVHLSELVESQQDGYQESVEFVAAELRYMRYQRGAQS